MPDSTGKVYLTGPQTARRYNITDRSLSRWVDDPRLGFPRPLAINHRKFFAVDELETWEKSRVAPSVQKAA